MLGLLLAASLSVQAPSEAQPSARLSGSKVCSKRAPSLELRDLDSPGIQSAQQHSTEARRFESKGDDSEAERELKAALAARPQDDSYVQQLALFYIERERYPEALGVIRGYVKSCGPTATGWALEAELLFKQRRYDEAFEAARNSLGFSDDDARMHELLGLIHVVRHRDSAGLAELRTASRQDPAAPQIRYYYGRALYTGGRYPEARDQFLACLKLRPGYPKALENLGLCYEALQDYAKAFDCYRRAMALEESKKGPKNADPYAYYGRLLFEQGQPQQAVAALKQAVGVSPKSFMGNYELGRALLSVGELEEAGRFLLTAESLDPSFPRTYYLLGKLRQRQNRSKEAAQYWATFEKLNKNAQNSGFPITDR
jgi:tetratricopeptide (TPR) repeat protein